MKPFFSVVIPTLNEEKYLPKLLRSLLKQEYQNFEVIVVDGRSVDNTQLVVQRFNKRFPHMRLITSEKNGPSVQRNLGAKYARGKYLVFFDADVQAPPEFLEGIHYEIIRHKPLFITTWHQEDTANSYDKMIITMVNMMFEFAKSIGIPGAPGFNMIIKRSVFIKIKGFNEKVVMSEDFDLTSRLVKAGYDLTILKEPRLKVSLRRLRTEGTLRLIKKFTHANIYFILKGPITHELFDYPMGGHVHGKKKVNKSRMLEIDTYLANLRKMEKKITRLMNA